MTFPGRNIMGLPSFRLLHQKFWRCHSPFRHKVPAIASVPRLCPRHVTNGQPQRSFPEWISGASNFVFDKSEALFRASYKRAGGLIRTVDDLLGISEVQEAQASVKKAEEEFMKTRREVTLAKTELNIMQEKLGEVRRKLDRVPRDDERYLMLATEEHKILVEEKKLRSEYERTEALERDRFALLSGAVRDSHEKERARGERTKHWSVMGSVGGAALGILGSSLMNYIRLRQIKTSVKDTGDNLMLRTEQLCNLIKAQDIQYETETTRLKESLSAQRHLLEEKLGELANLVNYVTLNIATEPLKDFGKHVPRPQTHAKESGSEQRVIDPPGQQGIAQDTLSSLASRIDSITEIMKFNQLRIQGDLRSLQRNMESLDRNLKQMEERTEKNVCALETLFEGKHSVGSDDVGKTTQERFVRSKEWWAKSSAVCSAICAVLSATALLYELLK